MGVDVKAECERFLPFATSYVEWLDQADYQAKPSLNELFRLLADLQAAATRLPDDIDEAELSADGDQHDRDSKLAWELALRVCKKLPFNDYCAVFDPVDADGCEAIMINLDDDLGDIYNDLAGGICRYRAGLYGDALWNWRFSYCNHWGRHLTHAQAAVYSRLAEWGAYTCARPALT